MDSVPCGRALFITPAFFGYEQDIVAELERQGFATTLIDERPSNNAVIRAICRFRKNLIARRIETYYRARMAELQGLKFDLVLVIKAEVIPRWFLQYLRRTNPGARFVYYSWDAVSNVQNSLEVLDCFDDRFSFDKQDVEARTDFIYLPLFYTSDFFPLAASHFHERSFDLSFVGTLHTKRYSFVKKLFTGRPRTFGFFYVQARWYFAFVKYLTREHRTVPWADVSFEKMTRDQVAEVFRNSTAVLDMPRHGQSGLTIRTFEVLASGSVLVTTNAAIADEPFFDPSRVVLVPGDLNESGMRAASTRLQSIRPPCGPPENFAQYSLESWVRTITASSTI